MFFLKRYVIRSFEMGLHFRDGEFQGLLGAGTYWFFDLFRKVTVEIVSRRAPFLVHEKLDLIVRSGDLKGFAEVLDLQDKELGDGVAPSPGPRTPIGSLAISDDWLAGMDASIARLSLGAGQRRSLAGLRPRGMVAVPLYSVT